jgi:hypothetical protein
MIRPAIWVLEQEYEFAKKQFSWGPKGVPPSAVFALIVMGVFQTAVISGMPYASLIQAHGFVEDYVWMRTAPQHRIKGFRIKSPGFKAVPFGWSVSRKAAFRLGAAKVAARFIPYVGWGLLAYDLYTVGKWAHGKIKD